MKKILDGELLSFVQIDLAVFSCRPGVREGLEQRLEVVSRGGWNRFRDAAASRAGDDQSCDGYLLKAQAIDLLSGKLIGAEAWTDMTQDQADRVLECLDSIRIRY